MSYEQYSDELFEKARGRILPLLLSAQVTEIEDEILKIVEALDGRRPRVDGEEPIAFNEWSTDDLLSAYGRLASLRVNLSRLASIAQSKTNYANRYKIYQQSKNWNPIKTRLIKEFSRLNERMVKADVENTLIEAFWETIQKEVFLQEISDRLSSLFDSTNQVLSAIKMRVGRLTKEEYESKHIA